MWYDSENAMLLQFQSKLNCVGVPHVRPSIRSEQELQASDGKAGTISADINLNPQQPITDNAGIGDTSQDIQSSTMCDNTPSMCNESIYEEDSKDRLKYNDEFKLVTNKRFKKSTKEKVNNSRVTHTF
jgi:hypothetical protein